MSDLESRVPDVPEGDQANRPGKTTRPSRLRRFFLRHLPLTVAGAAVVLAISLVGLYFWASSAEFEGIVRGRLAAALEKASGGRVEIGSFHWRLLDLEADADGIVIHGLESPGESPYAQIGHLRVRISVLGLWSPRVLLRELEISRPAVHLIVYPDGSTNQPHPRQPRKPRKPAIEELFDLEAGRVSVDQGELDYEDRAAAFDFQNRWALMDFDAKDVSLRLTYAPAGFGIPQSAAVSTVRSSPVAGQESYRIEAGAAGLHFSRGGPGPKTEPADGHVQATIELTRDAIYLRSLRLTAQSGRGTDHALEVSGALHDFAHPNWQVKTTGELDLKLLNPVFGYPFAPEGIAHLDLSSAGEAGEFRADGNVHVDDGSYIGTGVVATGIRLDAHVHADPGQLLISSVVARLRQGGQLEGDIALKPWLPTVHGAVVVDQAGVSPAPSRHEVRSRASDIAARKPGWVEDRNVPVVHPSAPSIPVNGTVTARFTDVALDTLLEMVSQPPFQHLGLDSYLNGPATAVWTDGDANTLAVKGSFGLSPSAQGVPGEVPSSGAVEGTYTQRDGAVDLRKLELHTPGSEFEAHGALGAYPLTSRTALSVEFHSENLADFDSVLRDLGLSRNGQTGTAALPVALKGRVDFLHGTWEGSLVDPRLEGDLKATQLAVEMPVAASPAKAGSGDQPSPQQWVHFDLVQAAGSYATERISIADGLLKRGNSEIDVSGTLVAASEGEAPGRHGLPEYDRNSVLHLRLKANKVALDDVQPFLSRNLPIAGSMDAQLQVDGPLHDPGGSGWAELDGGSVYGEPVKRIRAQGTIADQLVKLDSVTVVEAAGSASAKGSYNIGTRQFEGSAGGMGIDVARIDWLGREGLTASGKLAFSVTGSGSVDDPHLDAHATLSPLTFDGEALGGLEVVASVANRSLTCDATTRLVGTELSLHGQTALKGDYETQAKLEFSKFNIGALLELAHVKGLSGESSLAGTVTVAGPLARPEQLHGEAKLQELAVTVAGVHLKSEGSVHATLLNGRVHLDPLHVTGEETDLRAEGGLALKGARQLDFAASGSVNLKLAETLDPDLTASGTSTFQVEAHGPLKNPGMRGRVDFENSSLSLEDIPNGLSQLHGTLEFNQDRLEVRTLTAMSGGGLLSVAGYLAYQHGIYADLSVTGKAIRIRYPQGISSQADATLRLQGTQNNLLLGGDVLLTRFTMSPDLDIAALAGQANLVQTIAPPDAPSNHIRLNVHVVSSPQLNFQNAFAKLAGDVDLRLRGTVASPSLLGRISITEGNAIIAGTRYELDRGDISFTNPVRIEPSIDLNATARVEDYDITLGLHGTPDKLDVTYRSDPPLPEADVVGLLALGRTGNQQRIYTQQQEQALTNPTTDALLGGALNATVSSRVQKLFGAGSVKVDPDYLGAFGNSTSRIIVEEQLGRNLTLTYATDVNTTGQQLLQAEIAINRQVSLVVARDESGVFSMVFKATRRFK